MQLVNYSPARSAKIKLLCCPDNITVHLEMLDSYEVGLV